MLVITRGYIRNASLGKINIYFLLVSGWDIDRFPIHGMRRSPDTKSGRSLSGEQQRFKHQSGILINGNIPNHIRYIAMILEYSHIYIYHIRFRYGNRTKNILESSQSECSDSHHIAIRIQASDARPKVSTCPWVAWYQPTLGRVDRKHPVNSAGMKDIVFFEVSVWSWK